MSNAIEASELVKTFKTTKALNGLNLTVRKGCVYGLLGPNGAGKTTAIRVLTTLLTPDSGKASVLGLDVVEQAAAVRQKVSVTGQYASVDEDLTGQENLVLVCRLLGFSWADAKKRAIELLAAFGLGDAASRQVRTYSGGMRRRLDIAACLVTRPELLFLDEPTTGLDPRSRNQVWELVRQIASEGTTVLLTTQYLEEADRLAERLAVIDHGRVIAEGTSRDLKASIGGNALHLTLGNPEQQAMTRALISELLPNCLLPQTEPGALAVKIPDSAAATSVLGALANRKIEVASFSLATPSLDEVFFALTGRGAEAEVSQPDPAVRQPNKESA